MDVTSTTSGPIIFPWQLMFRMVMLIKVTWQLEQLCRHLVISCSQIPQKLRPAAEIISAKGYCCSHNRQISSWNTLDVFLKNDPGRLCLQSPWSTTTRQTDYDYETFNHETDLIKWMPFLEAQFCDLISSLKPQQISRKCWSIEMIINFSWMV